MNYLSISYIKMYTHEIKLIENFVSDSVLHLKYPQNWYDKTFG